MLRKKWEADLQSVATIKLLGEAMGNSSSDGATGYKRVSSDEMLSELGIAL